MGVRDIQHGKIDSVAGFHVDRYEYTLGAQLSTCQSRSVEDVAVCRDVLCCVVAWLRRVVFRVMGKA